MTRIHGRVELRKGLQAGHLPDGDVDLGQSPSSSEVQGLLGTLTGTVRYTGGGHSGYTGNDLALYDVGTNRWRFAFPPDFVPFFYNYDAALFGWTYNFFPTSQHTYLW
jgi:hypothetical protein